MGDPISARELEPISVHSDVLRPLDIESVDTVDRTRIEPNDEYVPGPLMKGLDSAVKKTGQILLFIAVAPLALLSGCSAKSKKEEPAKNLTKLERDVLVFQRYLKRQKVVDMSKMAGVYITEDVAKKPWLLGTSDPKARLRTIEQALKNPHTHTPLDCDATIHPAADGNHKVVYNKCGHKSVVLFPQRIAMKVIGNRTDRNMVDSALYHEYVHVQQDKPGSRYMNLAMILTAYVRHYKIGLSQQELMDGLKPVSELGAYLMEIDFLIHKKGVLKNARAVSKKFWASHLNQLVKNTHLIWELIKFISERPKWKSTDAADQVKRFLKYRIQGVSPEARRIYAKVLRSRGWKKSKPYWKYF